MRKLQAAALVAVLTMVAIGLSSCGGGSGKEGGTLTGSYASFPDYLDPALSYTQEGWTAMYNTYLPLLTYKHADGEEGAEVVPALADSLPQISADEKTYTLKLRDGLKYSDGTPIRASDFEATVERMFKLNSPGSPFYFGIEGAEEFAEGGAEEIAGIDTDNATGEITIRLTKPRGTFTNELAMLFVALVPKGTPAKNMTNTPLPASGPYEIVDVQPGRGWSYKRNPQWAKSNGDRIQEVPDGHVDSIDISLVRNGATQVNEIERDKTDWMQTIVPADLYNKVKGKYEGTQFRVEFPINLYYFFMNTAQPPFDDLKLRQAVNYAVDTAALERIYAGALKAAHQILPVGMPGHQPFNLYPHDMAKARQLFAEADPSDLDITVWTDDENPNDEAGAYFADVLDKLGFNATLKTISGDVYFQTIGNASTPDVDAGWTNWFQDYPHPNDYFQPLLAGESILPTYNTNVAQVDVPELNKKIERLGEQQLSSEQEEEYADLDREYMELAPWVPYGTNTVSTFVSSAIDLDSVIFNPTMGQDLTSFQFK